MYNKICKSFNDKRKILNKIIFDIMTLNYWSFILLKFTAVCIKKFYETIMSESSSKIHENIN